MEDKDPVTKKSWWYTTSDRHRNSRAEVPEKFKQIFAEKKITCGEQHTIPIPSILSHFLIKNSGISRSYIFCRKRYISASAARNVSYSCRLVAIDIPN